MTTTQDPQTRAPEPRSREEVGRYWLAVMKNQLKPGSAPVPAHPDAPSPTLDLDGPF